MTRIVEKPREPVSKLANIGLYYIRDVAALWSGIDHVLRSPKNQGEYFLTDAFQHMIDHGRRILTAEVSGWYDCGKLETLLETNEILLRKGAARHGSFPGVTIRDPVLIDEGVTIERSTIGPNVTIERGSVIRDSELSHALVGRDCQVVRTRLQYSMVGDHVVLRDFRGAASLADHSELTGTT
jgi:glucose-1-phosphate thymidylyltransferase